MKFIVQQVAISTMAALALSISGCANAVDGEETATEPDEKTGETAAAITADGYASLKSVANLGVPLDLGPAPGRTCFLEGVTGDLRGDQFGTPASVQVFIDIDNHWKLRAKAGNGPGVIGHATCISVPMSMTLGWAGNTGTGTYYSENKIFRATTPSTHCFLSEVHGTVGFASAQAGVVLQRDTVFQNGVPVDGWSIGGNLIETQTNGSGGGAGAVCVDASFTTASFSWQSSSNGAVTPLASATANMCGVTSLFGNYAYSKLGVQDGARIFPQGTDWDVFSSSGRGIAGTCHGTALIFHPPGF